MIKYRIVQGTIPDGLRVVSSKEVLRLSGVAPLGALFDPPVHDTPSGRIGVFNEGEPVSVSIDVSPKNGKTIIGGDVIGGALPFGLYLDNNFTITGIPDEAMIRVPMSFLPEDAPVWETREGTIAINGELEELEVTVHASGADYYNVVNGSLPHNILLDHDGLIHGTTGEASGPAVSKGPGPVWLTPRGRMGSFGEFQSINLGVSAVARSGDDIFYTITTGALPPGLTLDGSDGRIVGKADEIVVGGPSEDPSEATRPSLAPQNWVGKLGEQFNKTISPSIPNGRTTLSVDVTFGHLPFGLALTGNGISGTPTSLGLHEFEVTVTDSSHITARSTYSIEVTE